MFKLNKEQQQKVVENKGLIGYILKQFGTSGDMFDELFSEGYIGLCKAVSSFDESRGLKFATYAAPCIRNEMLMWLRRNRKYLYETKSLSESVIVNFDREEICIEDCIQDDKVSFEEDMENTETLEWIINFILNDCTREKVGAVRKAVIYFLSIGEMTQEEIADKFSLSQSYVSRIVQKVKKKIKLLESDINKIHCKNNDLKIRINQQEFELSLSMNIDKFFLEIAQGSINLKKITSFRVTSTKKKNIRLYLPMERHSFILLGEIIMSLLK